MGRPATLCSPRVTPHGSAGERTTARRALTPLLGGVLIGSTGLAVADNVDAELPRPHLRLSVVLASLSPEFVASTPPPPNDAPEPHPRLRLAAVLPALNPTRLLAAPQPTPPQTPEPADNAPIPAPAPPRPAQGARAEARTEEAGRRPPARTITPSSNSAPPRAEQASLSAASDAAVIGDADFPPADNAPALQLPTRNARPSPAERAKLGAATAKRGWGIAPIRWGGELSAGFRRRSGDESAASTEQVYEARLRVNSYIMQPYIALVSGDIGLTTIRAQSGGDNSAASSNLTGTSITGNGTLNLFPQSRFPFQASLGVSDSRSDGSIVASDTRRTRVSLRQDYRPMRGSWTTSGQYDRSELDGSFGSDVVNRFSATFSSNFDKHSFSTNGSLSTNDTADQSTKDFFVLGTHGYRMSDEVTINSSASYTRQDFQLGGQAAELGGTTQSAQLFSYASWTPEDSNWRGTANVRYFQSRSDIGSTSFDNTNLGGTASLSYLASRNLSFFGTLGVNSSSNGATSTSQNLGANYTGDAITLGTSTMYNWFGSTSVSNTTSTDGGSQRSNNVSFGHSLNRTWLTTEQSTLSGNLNQSVSTSRSTGLGAISSTSLTNGASLSLQASAGDSLSGFLSTSVSDTHVYGDNPSSFQMLNVQLSGNWRIDNYSQLFSNLTWQLSRQQSAGGDRVVLTDEFGRPVIIEDTSKSRNGSLSGGLGYSHSRFFGIRGLRYNLDFRANTTREDARRRGDPDAERNPDRATLDLDQRLRYSIGRLDTELQLRIAEIEGRRSELLFFRVGRQFGSF